MSSSENGKAPPRLLEGKVRIAEHAVYRVFALETVVLNVKKGTYHGLNPTAGRMLVVLDQAETVGQAVKSVAAEYGVPEEQIERDIAELCDRLVDRGLVSVSYGPGGD